MAVWQVSVTDYYQQKLVELEAGVAKRKEIALNSPLGMAFVTFKSINNAKQAECLSVLSMYLSMHLSMYLCI